VALDVPPLALLPPVAVVPPLALLPPVAAVPPFALLPPSPTKPPALDPDDEAPPFTVAPPFALEPPVPVVAPPVASSFENAEPPHAAASTIAKPKRGRTRALTASRYSRVRVPAHFRGDKRLRLEALTFRHQENQPHRLQTQCTEVG
jgi:hypothetical protein